MKWYFYLFIVFYSFSLFAQTESENLNGRVKILNIKTYLIDMKAQTPKLKYHLVKSFDQNSKRLTSVLHYGNGKNWQTKETYKYDGRGQLITKVTYRQGNIIDNSIVYRYNPKGKVIQETKMNARNKTLYKIDYKYNYSNQLIEKKQWFSGINFTVTESFEYTNNKLSKTTKQDKEGQITTLYKYNSSGQISDKGNYDKYGKLYSHIIYTYNTSKDKTALYKFDSKLTLTYFEEYKYTYDQQNNWKEKMTYEKGIGTMVEKRHIIYY